MVPTTTTGEQSMKLGFYVESNGGTPQNTEIFNFLNKEVESGNLTDAAVFFNSVNFNPVPHGLECLMRQNCGTLPAT